jgi:hypothetical protein
MRPAAGGNLLEAQASPLALPGTGQASKPWEGSLPPRARPC